MGEVLANLRRLFPVKDKLIAEIKAGLHPEIIASSIGFDGGMHIHLWLAKDCYPIIFEYDDIPLHYTQTRHCV